MEQYLIGIDVGTTGTKSMLFRKDGAVLGHAYKSYPSKTPALNWSEQNPLDWWDAIVETVRKVATKEYAPGVVAISLSLQGGTLVPVDEGFNPTRPAIVWNDSRCEEERLEFIKRFGAPYMYEKSGWNLGRGLNALSIAWIRKHEPDIFKKTRLFLSVPDYISAKMTGKPVVDISNVGINQLADIQLGEYDEGILDFLGISENQLPKIVSSGAPIGNLTLSAAKELGLNENTLLVAGAHDQYAALLGAGVLDEGDILIGTGTAWVVTALTNSANFKSGFSQSVSAVPGKWGSLVPLSYGGVSLDWLNNNILTLNNRERLDYGELNALSSSSGIGANGLFFYPYFAGGAYPNIDTCSKASLIGLDLSHTANDVVRAVMEGVSYQINWILDSFKDAFAIRNVKLIGGASKSELWSRMIADMAGLPVSIPEIPDLPCVGAAIMAGTGSSMFKSMGEGYKALGVKERIIQPDEKSTFEYAALRKRYMEYAKSLVELYRK